MRFMQSDVTQEKGNNHDDPLSLSFSSLFLMIVKEDD